MSHVSYVSEQFIHWRIQTADEVIEVLAINDPLCVMLLCSEALLRDSGGVRIQPRSFASRFYWLALTCVFTCFTWAGGWLWCDQYLLDWQCAVWRALQLAVWLRRVRSFASQLLWTSYSIVCLKYNGKM